MKPKSTSSYAHRGDRDRRRRRTRRALLAAGVVVTGALIAHDPKPRVAAAAPIRRPLAALVGGHRARAVAVSPPRVEFRDAPVPDILEPTTVNRARLTRWHRIFHLANQYGVEPGLAGSIHDIALAEGIEPELAFRLVRAESEFNEHATSRVGAVGLTQVMPSTARFYVRGVKREHLYDRHLNLHVGFRYLRGLIHEYKSLRLALLVYNRGPVAVDAALRRGDDPANGYEETVAKGYRGRGVVAGR